MSKPDPYTQIGIAAITATGEATAVLGVVMALAMKSGIWMTVLAGLQGFGIGFVLGAVIMAGATLADKEISSIRAAYTIDHGTVFLKNEAANLSIGANRH